MDTEILVLPGVWVVLAKVTVDSALETVGLGLAVDNEYQIRENTEEETMYSGKQRNQERRY